MVLSGPSAVGKVDVVRCLRDRIAEPAFQRFGDHASAAPGRSRTASTTTSSPRARFQQLIDEGALLEWAEIHGGLHRSGTPAQPIRDATAAGHPVLIEVDLAGARADQAGDARGHHACSWLRRAGRRLEARLVGRGTETPEVIARRLATARTEMAAQDDFDEVVVNSQLESACAELVSLLVGTSAGHGVIRHQTRFSISRTPL